MQLCGEGRRAAGQADATRLVSALAVVRVGDDGEQLVVGQGDGQGLVHELLHLERHVVDDVRHVGHASRERRL